MTRSQLPSSPAARARDSHQAFSIAVDRMRDGEQVVALIDPEALPLDPEASSVWLSARLTIGQLQRRFLLRCDERCVDVPHDPHAFVVVADLVLDPAEPRLRSWWESWTDSLQRAEHGHDTWYAGAPVLPDSPDARRLPAGTRLTRLTATDPYWVHYDAAEQEVLFRIEDGPMRGNALIATSFGLSELLPGLAGALIAPDHPPARDGNTAARMLAAGWALIAGGLPFEG